MLVLPSPPSSADKFAYQNPRRFLVYGVGAFSAGFLIMGIWLFVFAHPHFFIYGIFAAVMSANLILSYGVGILGRNFDFEEHKNFVHRALTGMPIFEVDVYLPICGEPIEVLANTWKAVRAMDWPLGMLHVYVLDDGDSDEAWKMADKFGFHYVRRRDRGHLKKAGNLRNAFRLTKAPFFVVFDADFCPHPRFLWEAMPYMEDQTVAIVQTPQFFTLSPDQSWVEKGAGYVQEFFYRLVQVSRDTFAGAICVGSNAIYRRAALEPFGGTAPIGYSEDVHTGFMVTDMGWRVKYIPVCLARGLCPGDLASFFIQQYRWATGSLTLFLNPKFWTSRLSIMQKACYLSGMLYYITTGLGILAAPLPAIILAWTYPDLVFWYNFLFSLPAFLFGMLLMPLWHTQPFGWYAFRCRVVAYHAHLFAMYDKARGSLVPWRATGAAGRIKRFEDFRHLCFYWTLFCLVLMVFAIGRSSDRIVDFTPTLFFTLFNSWISLSILRDQ